MVIQHFVECSSFLDFARYVCALREYPLRVYEFSYKKKKVFSTQKILSNSIIHFFTFTEKGGRYITYNYEHGKESADIVNEASKIRNYAPIIELDSLLFPLRQTKTIKEKFKPIKVHSLGDLVRLTYDPELPEDNKFTLLAFPYRKQWIIGYITEINLDETIYCFNYVELQSKPPYSFLKYSEHKGGAVEFINKFQHGFLYLPIVKFKSYHPIFGLK